MSRILLLLSTGATCNQEEGRLHAPKSISEIPHPAYLCRMCRGILEIHFEGSLRIGPTTISLDTGSAFFGFESTTLRRPRWFSGTPGDRRNDCFSDNLGQALACGRPITML